MADTNFGDITKRPDGSYVIYQGDRPFHVLKEENPELYGDVSVYAEKNPHRVKEEPPPLEQLHDGNANAKICAMFDGESGGGDEVGSNDIKILSGKVDKLENRFDGLENRFDGLERRFDGLERRFDQLWNRMLMLAAVIVAIVFGVVYFQSDWTRDILKAHNDAIEIQVQEFRRTTEVRIEEYRKTSEARMEEFRRDSDRNYDLALRALERSMATEAKERLPE